MDQRRLGVADGIADDRVSISHGQFAFLPKCSARAGSAYSTLGTRSYHANQGCRLLAYSGSGSGRSGGPLSGVERTWKGKARHARFSLSADKVRNVLA